MIFLDSDCLLQVCLSYISANVATFLIQPILLYILQINKENIPPIDIQPNSRRKSEMLRLKVRKSVSN